MISGPENGSPGRKNGFFGVDFENLLLDIFEKFFFPNFLSPMCISSLGFMVVGQVLKNGKYWAGPPTKILSSRVSRDL